MSHVCHLTTAHPRNDIRVFYKECMSVAALGYRATLVVADGKGNDQVSRVQICDIGKKQGRFNRFIISTWQCYKQALKLKADIYHLHDPELLYVGYLLALKGYKVVFDSHELTARQIETKFYIPAIFRSSLSKVYDLIEGFICKRLSAVVVPQEHLMVEYFSSKCQLVEVVSNYVSLEEYPVFVRRKGLSGKENIKLLYSGTISNARGLTNMLDLMVKLDEKFTLVLAGGFANNQELEVARSHPGWNKVDYRGLVNREKLHEIYLEADIGLILFNPVGQYVDATSPLKLFEYMLYGLPVITPDYGSWPSFQEDYGISKCIRVDASEVISQLINHLTLDDTQYEAISCSARDVVEQKYCWKLESQKLDHLYRDLLKEV